MIHRNSSFAEFQRLNKMIYLVVNDRAYENMSAFSRLHHHITCILKAVRKERYNTIEYDLCMALSWCMALANRYHVSLEEEMWKFFPGHCPYCLHAPCLCKERVKDRQRTIGKPVGKRPASLREWQKMFRKIYPNIVMNSAIHLAEEAGEVNEAIRNYSAIHDEEWFKKIVEELVDVITHIFSIASCLKVDLADCMVGYFSKGCPACHKRPCACGYVIVDQPVRLFHGRR